MVYKVLWRSMQPIKPGMPGQTPSLYDKYTGLHNTLDLGLYVPSQERTNNDEVSYFTTHASWLGLETHILLIRNTRAWVRQSFLLGHNTVVNMCIFPRTINLPKHFQLASLPPTYPVFQACKPDTLCTGDIIASPFQDDESWYRARIIGFLEDGEVDLYYVDFGDSDKMPRDSLCSLRWKKLPESFHPPGFLPWYFSKLWGNSGPKFLNVWRKHAALK